MNAVFRAAAAGVVAATLVAPACGSPAADAFVNLANYFSTAAALVGRLTSGIESRALVLSPEEQRDLGAVTNEMGSYSISQRSLSDEFDEFASAARDCKAPAEIAAWQHLQKTTEGMEFRLARLTDTVSSSPALSRVLKPEERLTLTDTLETRAGFFGRLRGLSIPCEPFEIRHLQAMGRSYAQLVRQLIELRQAIARRSAPP